VRGHVEVGNEKAIMPYTCVMVFPRINGILTTTSFLTERAPSELYSQCCVWVEYGRAIAPYKCSMVFLLIRNVWTTTSMSTLKGSKGLYS